MNIQKVVIFFALGALLLTSTVLLVQKPKEVETQSISSGTCIGLGGVCMSREFYGECCDGLSCILRDYNNGNCAGKAF